MNKIYIYIYMNKKTHKIYQNLDIYIYIKLCMTVTNVK